MKKYSFVELNAGFDCFKATGTALPDATVKELQSSCQGAIFGAVSSPSTKVAGYSSPIVALRKKLDLYANVRPVIATAKGIDMLIVRENTECLYIKQEKEWLDEKGMRIANATRQISEYASTRVAKMALELALKRQRTRQSANAKLTVVHKSNVLSITDGLFRESVLKVYEADRERYSTIQLEEQLVDSMVYRLFREPQAFDVVVAPNLYGDIISDAAAALVGSLGLVPGANVGDQFVIGEPVHGSAPDICGKNIANPIACIRSAALLLEYLDQSEDAQKINQAVDLVLSMAPEFQTPDVKGGREKTDMVVSAVCERL